MKKLFLLGIIAIALALGTNAQVQRKADSTQKVMKRNTNKNGIMSQADLTPEQRQKIKGINQERKEKANAIKSNESLTEAQKKEQLQQLNKEMRSATDAVLTKEQKEKMKMNGKVVKGNQGKKMAQANKDSKRSDSARKKMTMQRGNGQMMNMSKLNLTAEQQQKMKELNQVQKEKADAIRKNDALSKEQKEAQLKALNQSKQAQMKSILTKDQQEQMKEMRKENRSRVPDAKPGQGKKNLRQRSARI